MGFKVGVTTGLYYVAHDVSLASTVKKIGYTLTRGADVVEISGDTPHEVSYTEGVELRNMSKNQGLNFLFHGSLTVPMCMPERTDWRDAQDHMEKSVRSAVNSGCKYVLFHACLHFWVELMTYTGTKLTITMCDHAGKFVSEMLYQNKRLRNWFVRNMRNFGDIQYQQMILSEDELLDAQYQAHGVYRAWQNSEYQKRATELAKEMGMRDIMERENKGIKLTAEEQRKARTYNEKLKRIEEEVGKEAGIKEAKDSRRNIDKMVAMKLAKKDPEKRRWRIDTYGRLVDAYKIMAHHLFFTKDPQWMSMAKVYKDVLERYNMDYNDDDWLMDTWDKAEKNNDTDFKQFFYATVGAKFLEGHIRALFEWMDNKLIPEELDGKEELQEIARKLQVTIEIPDARDPKYAGRYMLCHPNQIYSAVKTTRDVLEEERLWMTIDNEHLATQGYDPWVEGKKLIERFPEFGKLVISVHCAYPTPLHSHYPIELGQVEVYELLWFLRQTGAGKEGRTTYLIFERGGGDDPFRQSVDALRLMAKFLEQDLKPDELPMEFFGLDKTAFNEDRQKQIMMDHRFDVLKDLFEIPEEEWGMLSSVATKKGKREMFKKEELQ